MARIRLAGLVAAAGLLSLAACQAQKQPAADATGETEPLFILGRAHGSDSAFKQPGAWIFNSHAALVAAGSQEAVKMDIDFGSHSLLVVALGEEHARGYWVRISGAQRLDDVVYVQGIANAPVPEPSTPAESAGHTGRPMVTFPFDAVVIPKVKTQTIHPEIESVVGQSDTVPIMKFEVEK